MIPILTTDAPAPSGPYSQAVRSNDLVFASGQLPIDLKTLAISDDTTEQMRNAFTNLLNVMRASEVKEILSVTIYLTNMNDFPIMNSVYGEFFDPPYPARTCVGVMSLPKGARVMVDAIGRI